MTESEFRIEDLPGDFQDLNGTTWKPSAKLPAAKRLREAEGLNGFDLYSMKAYGGLLGDWNVAATVLYYCCCFDEDGAPTITLAKWGDLLDASIIERGVYALGRALIDFFPPSRRKEAATTVASLYSFQKKASQAAERIAASPIFEKAVDADLAKIEKALEEAAAAPGLSTQSLASAIDALGSQD